MPQQANTTAFARQAPVRPASQDLAWSRPTPGVILGAQPLRLPAWKTCPTRSQSPFSRQVSTLATAQQPANSNAMPQQANTTAFARQAPVRPASQDLAWSRPTPGVILGAQPLRLPAWKTCPTRSQSPFSRQVSTLATAQQPANSNAMPQQANTTAFARQAPVRPASQDLAWSRPTPGVILGAQPLRLPAWKTCPTRSQSPFSRQVSTLATAQQPANSNAMPQQANTTAFARQAPVRPASQDLAWSRPTPGVILGAQPLRLPAWKTCPTRSQSPFSRQVSTLATAQQPANSNAMPQQANTTAFARQAPVRPASQDLAWSRPTPGVMGECPKTLHGVGRHQVLYWGLSPCVCPPGKPAPPVPKARSQGRSAPWQRHSSQPTATQCHSRPIPPRSHGKLTFARPAKTLHGVGRHQVLWGAQPLSSAPWKTFPTRSQSPFPRQVSTLATAQQANSNAMPQQANTTAFARQAHVRTGSQDLAWSRPTPGVIEWANAQVPPTPIFKSWCEQGLNLVYHSWCLPLELPWKASAPISAIASPDSYKRKGVGGTWALAHSIRHGKPPIVGDPKHMWPMAPRHDVTPMTSFH
eukprot:Skav209726  [mRNA]  locus=scaffold528:438100:439848:+ [translate_table: standard]